MLKFLQSNNTISKKEKSFTTVELIVSIAIISIMAGFFLLNYNSQKSIFDLNNGLSSASQEIRKVQALTIAQDQPCGSSAYLGVLGIQFTKNTNFVSFYNDRPQNDVDTPNLTGGSVPEKCQTPCGDADSGAIKDECVERRYLPLAITISRIDAYKNGSLVAGDITTGWVSFEKDTLAVKINGSADNYDKLKISFCISSSCTANTKTITINNKGMVDSD